MRPLRPGPHGLITAAQLRDQRFTHKDVERLVRWGRLVPLHRGVHLVAPPDTLAGAALLAAGEDAALCRESSLFHLDLRPWEPGPVHVNLPGRGGRSRAGRIEFHRARIDDGEIVTVRGLRTTGPTRTLLDVAPRLPRHALLRALEQAERLRAGVDRARLDACRHLAQPLELFDHYGACTRSDAEAMFLFLCEDHRIVRPLVNVPFAGAEADFLWPQALLVVEVDGYEFHEGRSAFERDCRKGSRYRRADHELIRFSAAQVAREAADVAATILHARPQLRRS